MNDFPAIIPPKRTFRLGKTFWLVIIVGLLFNAISFIVYSDSLTIQQCLYRLDFRCWLPSLAYPLWLIVAFLTLDAVTLRLPHADAGVRKLRFESITFAVKVCLAILITYFVMRYFIHFSRHWFWWYPANLLLFTLFTEEWLFIYKTKNRTDFTSEIQNVRKHFLIMSFTITGELGIYNVLELTRWIYLFSFPLWDWFRYGGYTHWGAAAFVMLCAAIGLTVFTVKEWWGAIRQARKAQKIINNHQQLE